MIKLDMQTSLQLEKEAKMSDIYFKKEGEYYYTNWEEIERFPFAQKLDKKIGIPDHYTFAASQMIPIKGQKEGEDVGSPATHKFHERHFAIFLHCLLDGYKHFHQRRIRAVREEWLEEDFRILAKVRGLEIRVPKDIPDPVLKHGTAVKIKHKKFKLVEVDY